MPSFSIFAAMLPQPFLQSIQGAPGLDAASFEAVHGAGHQVTSIRVNPAKQSLQPLFEDTKPVPWCKYGSYLAARPLFTADPNLHAGAYYVQDASSMFLWHALTSVMGHNTQQVVLDACAAPGGKSTLLQSFFAEGLVVSNEVIKTRAQILVENVTKWGQKNVVVTHNDPAHFAALPGFFDVLVVDAPCSGSGLFRKDPDAVAEWSLDNVALCSQRQQRILADLAHACKNGGWLLYSTCSYSIEENEDMVDWLIETQGFESVEIPVEAAWGIVTTSSQKQGGKGYRFYPDKLEGEGFFLAVLQKKGIAHQHKYKEQALTKPNKPQIEALASFYQPTASEFVFAHDTAVKLVDLHWQHHLKALVHSLYIKKAGITLGSLKGKDWIPSHEIAVSSLSLATSNACVAVDKATALQYLRRKEFDLDVQGLKGWVLVQYNGLGLGFIKALPNRLNNYYPQEWRILHV